METMVVSCLWNSIRDAFYIGSGGGGWKLKGKE